jgi:hypothetical protein
MNEITLNPDRPLTLADLRQVVERCGEFGIGDDSEVRAIVGWGGKLKKLTVREAPASEPRPPKGSEPPSASPNPPPPVPPHPWGRVG